MNQSAFDRARLEILPLSERVHDLSLAVIKELETVRNTAIPSGIATIAKSIEYARKSGGSIVLMLGAHVIRSGVQRYIIDLMERGYISCLSANGASLIHDFEFALIGETTESVSKYIVDGRFGMWRETAGINTIVNETYRKEPGAGLGESVGKAILEGHFPYKDTSIFAAAVRLGIPATVHVSMGCDIIHQHPNCDGAATGQLSYNDFLILASVLQKLENGVVMNFGSAVTAPEVYLKALSMARNVARQEGRSIKHFSTLVCDLVDLPADFDKEPPKDSAAYYFRPWKTMLVRTVADGGKSFYVKGRHRETIPALWTAITMAGKDCK